MQGQVWFDTIAWPGPGPVCTFFCLYISDLAELYYSRVFCACANPARNGVTQIMLSQSLLSNRREVPPIMYILSKKDECISRSRKFSCLYDHNNTYKFVSFFNSFTEDGNSTRRLDFKTLKKLFFICVQSS